MCSQDPAPTYTEEWRRECEARLVLSWPLQARRDFLAQVLKRRGVRAQHMLMDDMTKMHAARKALRMAA